MKKTFFVSSLIMFLAAGCGAGTSVGNKSQAVRSGFKQIPAPSKVVGLAPEPQSCEQVVSLAQLKTILGDGDLMLGLGDSSKGQSSDADVHLVTCIYQNYDLKNPTNIKKRIVSLNFTLFKYSDLEWRSSLDGLSNETIVTGLGSKAYRYTYNAKSNSAAYFVISSNSKYIFSISVNDATNNTAQGSSPGITENVAQENQFEIDIIKAIDANLSNF